MSGDTSYRNSVASQQQYNSFLERANRQFARRNQNVPDPFMPEAGARDEKQNSPLNKANEVADGGVTADFIAKLRALDSKNSQNELSIENFLTKSEEEFFNKVGEDKRETAASLRSQRDSFYHSNTSRSSFYSAGIDPPSFGDEMGVLGGGESGSATIVIPSRFISNRQCNSDPATAITIFSYKK